LVCKGDRRGGSSEKSRNDCFYRNRTLVVFVLWQHAHPTRTSSASLKPGDFRLNVLKTMSQRCNLYWPFFRSYWSHLHGHAGTVRFSAAYISGRSQKMSVTGCHFITSFYFRDDRTQACTKTPKFRQRGHHGGNPQLVESYIRQTET